METKTPTLKDIKNIQLQNNYSNKILHTISYQVDIIESKLKSHHYPIKSQPQPIDRTKPLF